MTKQSAFARLLVSLTIGVASTAAVGQPLAPQNSVSLDRLDPNEVICEKKPVTGSRLSKGRTCMTRAKWEERRRADREWTESAQKGGCVAVTTGSVRKSC